MDDFMDSPTAYESWWTQNINAIFLTFLHNGFLWGRKGLFLDCGVVVLAVDNVCDMLVIYECFSTGLFWKGREQQEKNNTECNW